MARIAGVDLPSEKRIEVALTYIYGIGRSTAKRILATAGVSRDLRVKNLSDEDSGRLRNIIEREYKVEGSLRSEMAMNVKRLMDIGAYRGPEAPARPPGARAAHADERTDEEGPEEDGGRDEEAGRGGQAGAAEAGRLIRLGLKTEVSSG
jgi:small subunit ribosomal protein S13